MLIAHMHTAGLGNLAHNLGNAFRPMFYLGFVLALYHNAQQWLRAGRPQ